MQGEQPSQAFRTCSIEDRTRLVHKLIALKVRLEALMKEAPHKVQLDIAGHCINDQSISCSQLDLGLRHLPILQGVIANSYPLTFSTAAHISLPYQAMLCDTWFAAGLAGKRMNCYRRQLWQAFPGNRVRTSRVLHRSRKVDLREERSFLERRLASPLLVARSFMRATTSSIPVDRFAPASARAG